MHRQIEIELPQSYADYQGIIQVRHEEDALCWFWAFPDLMPWPSTVWWLYTPVTGNRVWPGDLWGIDDAGELLVIECKQGRRNDDPFVDFVNYHQPGRAELTGTHWLKKWRRHLAAEIALPSAIHPRVAGRTDGILPRSNKRAHIQRWEALSVLIDRCIRSPEYTAAAEAALRARTRRGDPTPHYIGLVVAGPQHLSRKASESGHALRRLVGPDQAHFIRTQAETLASGRLRITAERIQEW